MSLNIAITLRGIEVNGQQDGHDALSRDWYTFLNKCDSKPVLIPNLGRPVLEYLDGWLPDGILLTGGNNLSPLFCTAEANDMIGDISVIRDETELALLDMAVKNRLPLFGVCRGIQVINSYFKGEIVFNFYDKIPGAVAHAGTKHEVMLCEPRLTSIAGTDRIFVNSYHNHAFTEKETGKGLLIAATAPDGSVEAVLHETLPIAGIMWHPERPNPAHAFDMEFITRFFRERGV